MTALSVNLNAVAHLRNRRDLPWPSVTEIGSLALAAGANGLTVHPRPDERHIRRIDVFDLVELMKDWPGREFNIEGYPDERFLALCEAAHPDQVTLVPDDPAQSTSDHGWDIAAHSAELATIIRRLHAGNMRVSLFIDADPDVPALAVEVGADRVEMFTGPYGHPHGNAEVELAKLVATAAAARTARGNSRRGGAGLGINAGHDLTLDNIPALKQAIPDIAECSIGHGLMADALKFGIQDAVKRYVALLADR